MTYTYDLNTHGCLIIKADLQDRQMLLELLAANNGNACSQVEWDALESLICNSELDWIRPEECGDLTDAPMLGIRNEDGTVFSRWGFMDYALRSFVNDLIDTGKAVFIS